MTELYKGIKIPGYNIANLRLELSQGENRVEISLLLGTFKIDRVIPVATINNWKQGEKLDILWSKSRESLPYLATVSKTLATALDDLIINQLSSRDLFYAIAVTGEGTDKERIFSRVISSRSDIGALIVFIRKHRKNLVCWRLPIGQEHLAEENNSGGNKPEEKQKKPRVTNLKKIRIR